MFFARIYARGRPFQPSWRSYGSYFAVITGLLLAVEYGVVNVFPDHAFGQLLLTVPAFYFSVAVVFLANDVAIDLWRLLKGRRRKRTSR